MKTLWAGFLKIVSDFCRQSTVDVRSLFCFSEAMRAAEAEAEAEQLESQLAITHAKKPVFTFSWGEEKKRASFGEKFVLSLGREKKPVD